MGAVVGNWWVFERERGAFIEAVFDRVNTRPHPIADSAALPGPQVEEMIPWGTRYGSNNHLEDRRFEWRSQFQPQLEQVRALANPTAPGDHGIAPTSTMLRE